MIGSYLAYSLVGGTATTPFGILLTAGVIIGCLSMTAGAALCRQEMAKGG